MNAHFADSALAQPLLVSILFSCLLLITAVTLLRGKQNAPISTIPLQFFCLSALMLQLAALAQYTNLITFNTKNHLDLIVVGIWLISLAKLIDYNANQKLRLAIKLILFSIWFISFLWLLKLVQPPTLLADTISTYNALLSIGPTLSLCLLSLYALKVCKENTHSINFFLLGATLYASNIILLAFTTNNEISFSNNLTNNNIEYINPVLSVVFSSLLFIGAIRYPPRQAFSLSRKAAFYSVITVSTLLFMLLLTAVGSYAEDSPGKWSTIFQFILIALACLGMCYISLSRSIRNAVRVYINKNFFRHKYDYRNIWLNLIHTLSNISGEDDFFQTGLQAVGDIFHANGGALWLKNNTNQFDLAANWNVSIPANIMISTNDKFILPMIEEEWIYALSSSGKEDHDRHLKLLPGWIIETEKIWIVAPLRIGKKLVGFFLLTQAAQNEALIWEDIDVIKSAGRQLASYIVRQQSAEELAESKQFDTYNKLTAFIMHDLKNLIAQQALVVENAKKHKENPAFVEDAIRTIDNSVARMSHLLKRLQRNSHQSAHRSVSVKQIIMEAIRKCADRQPIPTLRSSSETTYIIADHDQIVLILMHVIRNAQDATPNDGFIDVDIMLSESTVNIEVEDNGCGMDENFLNNRLFKPFDSTKSSMGMGIGAYQVREFIESMGGKIKVVSEVDAGTTLCIQLPIAYNEK